MTGKICILSSVHRASDTRIFHRQAKSLAGAGYDVTLIAQHDKDETIDGIKIVALPETPHRFRRILGTWRVFRLAVRRKADVYHIHDPELIPAGILLKAWTRRKVVYDIHEDVPRQVLTKEWLPPFLRRLTGNVYALLERFSISAFDAVLVAGDDIRRHLPASPKIVTVRNYPPAYYVNQRLESGRNSSHLPVVIYAGELATDRCTGEIVDAIEWLRGRAKLTLIGSFPDPRFEKELKARACSHVEFVDWLPYDTVWSYLRKADIGMVLLRPGPNNHEASERNRKLYEYMSAGLPVIASDIPSWRNLVEGNKCGLAVNPLDPREIAKGIEYLIENPAEARRMGENGRKAVLEKYNWEKESEKLLALYASLTK